MLNTKNYFDAMKGVNISQLPEALKKGHDFILKSTENMDNWKAYENGDSTRKAIDMIFQKMGQYLETQKPKEVQTKKEEPKKETPPTKGREKKENDAPIKRKAALPPVQEREDIELVERIPDEIKFIRRCLSLHGKKKTKEDLLSFINAMHRSILEKRIRKTSPYAKQMNYIQEKLVKRYNEKWQKKAEGMVLNEGTITEFKEIIASQKVLPSVALIKRYIGLNGKYDVKDRASKLLKAMNAAIEKGKVNAKDKYYEIYDRMLSNINSYIKNKSQKILSIEETELNGLNGFLGHCGCKALHGSESENKSPGSQVMNSLEFKKMEFKTLGFTGKYLKLIGDPSKGFSVMVFGRPKKGKSILCIDFAGYLARNHGKVLYVAKEEGLDYTLQEKLKATDVAHPNLDVTGSLPENLSQYDFVFLDSVTKLELSWQDLERLKNTYPDISFVFIFQTTKSGAHKGKNDMQHNVDVVIEVAEKGKAIQFGRFNQGGEMDIFENKQAAGLDGERNPLKYDTTEKKIKTIRKEGNLITFKNPIQWMGKEFSQIQVYKIEKRNGHLKIVGSGRDTPWFTSMDDLLEAIDWDLMEVWHRED